MRTANDQGRAFRKQDPIFYAGDELHRIKQAKVQKALARSDLDALVLFKAEAVRYLTGLLRERLSARSWSRNTWCWW